VDVDSSELGRNFQSTVPVVGDAKLFLQDLLTYIKGRVKRVPLRMMPRVKEVVEATAAYIAEVKDECSDPQKPIKTKRVIYEACRVFGPKTVLVNENGSQDLWSYYWPYWAVGALDGCVAPASRHAWDWRSPAALAQS
jgi:acetolactate synthase-1/2/3 large subunit